VLMGASGDFRDPAPVAEHARKLPSPTAQPEPEPRR
jgi:hypothetical protein